MEMTDQVKTAIIASYWNQEVMIYKGDNDCNIYKVTAAALTLMDVGKVSLQVKRVSSLTIEHITQILNIINDDKCQYDIELFEKSQLHLVFKIETSDFDKLWFEIMNDGGFRLSRGYEFKTAKQRIDISTHHVLNAYQYLKENGFGMPHLDYSIQDIIDQGIFTFEPVISH